MEVGTQQFLSCLNNYPDNQRFHPFQPIYSLLSKHMIEGWTQEHCQTQLMSLAATDMNKSTVLGDIQTRNRFLEFRFMNVVTELALELF